MRVMTRVGYSCRDPVMNILIMHFIGNCENHGERSEVSHV